MEQTNPQAGVSQEAAIHEPSIQDRMEAFIGQSEDQVQEAEAQGNQPSSQPQEAQTAEQPNDQANEELTPEDLEPQEAPQEQSAVDAFEIVHNGQQVKLSRAETIQYAQQGFDYTRKVQAVAEKDRHLDGQLRALAEVDQVRPYLREQEAHVTALEFQLRQYQGVDWVKEANEDPVGYAQKRAVFDQIREAYGNARQTYDNASNAVKQRLAQVDAERRFQEAQRLPELIPEWKDTQKRQAGEAEIVKHYANTYGVSEQELRANLKGAVSLAVVYKAMKYDQLLKAKGEKVKQLRTAPPVTKPGAAQTHTAGADRDVQLRQSLKKSGNREDAVAVLLNRMK